MKTLVWVIRVVLSVAAGIAIPLLVENSPLDYYLLPELPITSPTFWLLRGALLGAQGALLGLGCSMLLSAGATTRLPVIAGLSVGALLFGLSALPTLQPIPSGSPRWFDYACLAMTVLGPVLGSGLSMLVPTRRRVSLTSVST